MSVFHNHGAQRQFQGRLEDRACALRLPELDIEPILRIPDLAIRFSDSSHDLGLLAI